MYAISLELLRAIDAVDKGGRLTNALANRQGTATPLFAAMFAVLMLFGATALEFGRISNEVTRDQRALDTAVLAASDRLGYDDQHVTGPARANAFYDANRGHSSSKIDQIQLDAANGEVTANTKTDWKASLLKALNPYFPGIGDDRVLSVNSKVARGSGSVEVALVLDNSGSMSGSYISDLRTAAADMVKVLFAGAEGSDRVMVGIVPFAASVNVGAQNANASWIDGSGQSSIHFENFSENRTRFQLFSDLGQSWRGCVEARPGSLDVSDAPPSSGNTLFVPMFAPDEPGDAGSTSLGYNNSYLHDDGGDCDPYPRTCVRYSRRGNCKEWRTERLSNAAAQARTCKYRSQPAFGASGPNYMCTTQAVLPLNTTRAVVESAIQSMQANGNTNIKEGVAWGWRVLSPSAPFEEGREYGTDANRKIMILMTDGENFYSHRNTHNKSIYASHGYASKGRLGGTYSLSAYRSNLNSKTLQACANAKAEGITIYTVAFRLENDPTTLQLLRECASDADNAFMASDGGTLIQSFQNIGREISNLRVAG